MSVLIISGPPASGKNTVAEHLARRWDRCAVIDVDTVQHFVAQPYCAPWEGEEGARQQHLAVRNTSALVRNYESDGFDTIVLDVLNDETARLYRHELRVSSVHVVQLLPTADEVFARLLSRPDYLSRGDTESLYEQQQQFSDYDERLDNTDLDPEQAAEWLHEHWLGARK